MKMNGSISLLKAMVLCSTGLLLAVGPVAADTLRVPDDFATIQAAIEFAIDGDTVLVAPGTYVENINFLGKAITVTSELGPDLTIIDGNAAESVVLFISGETSTSVIDGFTIRNGRSGFYPSTICYGEGGGICVRSSSPTIINNTILENVACDGNAIAVGFGSPNIENNIITDNRRVGCSGGTGGGGILIRGFSEADIIGNVISNNNTGSSGGGISLFAAGNPHIEGNVITENVGSEGGGISMLNNVSGARIIQNLIAENIAHSGGGIKWSNPPDEIINNTIVNNNTFSGKPEDVRGRFGGRILLINNIIAAKDDGTAVVCDFYDTTNPPIFEFNDIFSPLGFAFSGICVDPTGTDGNISLDPLFVEPANDDYHLQPGSPSIDAGDNTAPGLPPNDLDGRERIIDGDGDSVSVVDMGAFEFGQLEVSIDIKPGSSRNAINTNSRGVIPVAILSTEEFDAPIDVEESSLTFGRTGDEPSLRSCPAEEDVDDDRLVDLICYFNTQATGLQLGDTEAVLKGETVDGLSITGSDSVKVIAGGYSSLVIFTPSSLAMMPAGVLSMPSSLIKRMHELGLAG